MCSMPWLTVAGLSAARKLISIPVKWIGLLRRGKRCDRLKTLR